MIIERLDLKAFGRFSDESLDLSAGPRRFHLVYGPNESGKSTCLRAISWLLFGVPNPTVDSFLHSGPKLRVGATLLDKNAHRLSIVRRKNGKVKLHAEDDITPVDEALLTQMLGGIDEATFHNRFGLSHEQLVVGGKAIVDSKGELGEILFASGAGVGRLKAIQTELENESLLLFRERGQKQTINRLLKELDEKRKELRNLQTPPAEYQLLRKQLKEALQDSETLACELTTTNQNLAKRKSYREAFQIVPVWKRNKARLAELFSVPMLDDDFSDRRFQASSTRETYGKSVSELQDKIVTTKNEIDSCPVDAATIENEDEIVSLFQNIAARLAASKDQSGLQRVVKNHNRHLRELLRDLDVSIEQGASQSDIDHLADQIHVSDSAQIRITELAGDYELLRQQESDSGESLQGLRKQLHELETEIEGMPSQSDPALIDSILTDIGSPASLLDPRDQQQATCQDLLSECDQLLRELKLGTTSLGDAVALQIPTAAEIEDHDAILIQHQQACKNANQTLDKLSQHRRNVTEELEQIQSDGTLPTESELAVSRSQRDDLVDQLESDWSDKNPIQNSTRAVRKSILGADDVVDTIRAHHDQVAERAAIEKELASLQKQIVDAEAAAKDAKVNLDQATSAWDQIWLDCGIPAGNVRVMRTWVAAHKTLVEKSLSLEKARTNLASANDRIQRGVSRLASAINRIVAARPNSNRPDEANDPTSSDTDYATLHDIAMVLRSDLVAEASRFDHLERKRSEIQTAIPKTEAKHEFSVKRRKKWDSDWKLAIGEFSGAESSSPSVIGMRLKKIAQLFQEKRERDILLGRIGSIDHDNVSFAERVQVVSKLVGLKTDSNQRGDAIAQVLYERLQETKQAVSQHAGMQKDLASWKDKWEADSETLQAAQGQLAELCRQANVTTPEELPAVEEQSREKREVVQKIEHAETQLTLIAGGDSVDDFSEQVQSHDPVELEFEINQLEHQLQSLNQQWSSIQQKVGALNSDLSEIDGSDQAAQLNQDLQLLSGRIERESQLYAKHRVASMILKQSIEHYRSENESPVLKLACQAFEDLTCGRYSGLKPEYDDKGRSKLFGVQKSTSGEEDLVPVDAMSLGTADALFLAMRLASLEHQLSAGHAIPVVIDDCLIQLDDDRTIAAMKRLSKLSERTQVILFTHHQHLIELAESSLQKTDYHVHRLMDSP